MDAKIIETAGNRRSGNDLPRQYWLAMVDSRQVRLALRRLRTEAKLTPDDLAVASGVDRATVYRIEDLDNKTEYSPKIETIAAMASGLGFTLAQFFAKIEGPLLSTTDRGVLPRHSSDQRSTPTGGTSGDETAAYLLRELTEQFAEYKTRVRSVQDATRTAADLAAGLETDAPPRPATRSRRRR